MSHTHWKRLNNPDYIGAYALEPGQDLVATIKTVKRELITGADGKKEECTVVYFAESTKPLILNTTNAKTIEKIYKTPYIEDWQGKRIQMFATPVKAFGDTVDALRIRPYVPKSSQAEQIVKCADCSSEIKAFGGKTAAGLAEYTTSKYGKALCSDCATKAAAVPVEVAE